MEPNENCIVNTIDTESCVQFLRRNQEVVNKIVQNSKTNSKELTIMKKIRRLLRKYVSGLIIEAIQHGDPIRDTISNLARKNLR